MFPLAVLFDQDLVQDDVSRCGKVQVPADRSLRRSGTPKFPSSTFRRRSITGSTLLDASAQPSTRPPNSVYGCCHQHSTSPSLSSDCQMLLPLSVTGLDRRVPYVNNTYITNGNDFISDGKSWNVNIDERINFEKRNGESCRAKGWRIKNRVGPTLEM